MKIEHMSTKMKTHNPLVTSNMNSRYRGLLSDRVVTWCRNGDDKDKGSDKGGDGLGTFDGGARGTCTIM